MPSALALGMTAPPSLENGAAGGVATIPAQLALPGMGGAFAEAPDPLVNQQQLAATNTPQPHLL